MSFDKLAWQRKHRKENRVVHSGYHRTWRRNLRLAVLKKLGGKCANPACQWLNADGSRGCTDWRCLQVDHVHGNGNTERKLFINTKGIGALYRKILADTDGLYQLLCANCNWIKKYVNREDGSTNVVED